MTQNGECFTIGADKFGCLGLGEVRAVTKLTKINIPSSSKIIDILSNYYNTFTFTEDQIIFTWGSRNNQQSKLDWILIPTKLQKVDQAGNVKWECV